MAIIQNPRKQFNFRIIAPGLNPFLVQKFTIPGFEIEQTEHGDTNYLVKTGGIIKVTNATLEKISPADAPDSWFFTWLKQVQDYVLGGGLLPSIYKQNIVVQHLSNDNITVLNTYTLEGAWPQKLDPIELDRVGSDNTLEKCELSVDRVIVA